MILYDEINILGRSIIQYTQCYNVSHVLQGSHFLFKEKLLAGYLIPETSTKPFPSEDVAFARC